MSKKPKKIKREFASVDNPLLRHDQLSKDVSSGKIKKNLAVLRGDALKQAHRLDTESARNLQNRSHWIQLGPTAIPNGQTYSPKRVLVTGRVTTIVVDPKDSNIIFAGAAQGGIWKSLDGGKNWMPKSDREISLAIGALTIDPTNSQILYVGTGEANFSGDSYYGNGILKSKNGGNSWSLLGIRTFRRQRISRIEVNPQNPSIVFVTTSQGLYRSNDSGRTWKNLISRTNATDMRIDPADPDVLYVAFWGYGIVKVTKASSNFSITKLAGGLPSSGFSRIALGISSSSPDTLYALMADQNYTISKFYVSRNAGTTWKKVDIPGGDIGGQGFYNLHLAVDPTTPDIVYLSGVSIWKGVYKPSTDSWQINNIGKEIHPDNHVVAFDPNDNQIIYAGNDGGIYKSIDAGQNWDDTINEGLCITQFEFMEHHPTSDAVIFAGTQDNGTESFQNSPVFYHAADGDGGFSEIDQDNPQNVIHTYYNPTPHLSTKGGKFGSWMPVNSGIQGNSLFYPPLALNESNQKEIVVGTDRLNLDTNQGRNHWSKKIPLENIGGDLVSAVHYVNSDLIYCATNRGKVYRAVKENSGWKAKAIHKSPLPNGPYIWDVQALPEDENTIVLVMAGFGHKHVWKGEQTENNFQWKSISGVGTGRLVDIPVNALIIDEDDSEIMYIGTDVGVARTTDGGKTWRGFSVGLPNCAVYDMRLHKPTKLLRVATHGRGIWERKIDSIAEPQASLFLRNNLMDTGRESFSSNQSAAFEDILQNVRLGDVLRWNMCPDIKIDSPNGLQQTYQMSIDKMDYLAFASKLQHRKIRKGVVNRVYVQVHNRGVQNTRNVLVKLLYADAVDPLANLPQNFWKEFPDNINPLNGWNVIGTRIISDISPTKPEVVEWNLILPSSASNNIAIIAIVDTDADPIQDSEKALVVEDLVKNSNHVGLRTISVEN